MTPYQCDCCGRMASRLHAVVAYGMDCTACDECCDYDPEAYGEEADPLLMQQPRKTDPA